MTTTTTNSSSCGSHGHACEIEVTFPTNLQAEQALQVLQVDQEPTDRVTKTFHLLKQPATTVHPGDTDTLSEEQQLIYLLKVRFESKELKMLRVSVSSFYDYLSVVLKTLQEFDTTTMI
jgi:hypothetical protein